MARRVAKDHTTEITVAIIALIGALGTAVIARWPPIFRRDSPHESSQDKPIEKSAPAARSPAHANPPAEAEPYPKQDAVRGPLTLTLRLPKSYPDNDVGVYVNGLQVFTGRANSEGLLLVRLPPAYRDQSELDIKVMAHGHYPLSAVAKLRVGDSAIEYDFTKPGAGRSH